MNSFSFQPGWAQVRQSDAASVRQEIMSALEVTTRPAFLARLRGDVEPKVSEYIALQKIFHNRGIFEIWGDKVYDNLADPDNFTF